MPQPHSPQPAIEFRGVTKSFSHGSGRRLLMLQLLRQLAGHWKQSAENPFYALRDISFSIDPGESWR
ncbi:MAG: hypothetical protein IPJ98_01510 [Bryobacterales bacterium]|nr:hypothetical protein [Bryobacterales bacterium]